MSVEPGYGGQPFEESIYEKVKRSVEIMDETGIHVPISIDGGVNTAVSYTHLHVYKRQGCGYRIKE